MNDYHYLPRHAEATIEAALRAHPVVVLAGARQTGKTTLAERRPGRTFRTFDDLDVLEAARRDPASLILPDETMTFDEVQRAPEFLSTVKRAVDRDRRPGRFLLTGSANLLLMRRVSETLAGRAAYLTLWPMTESEKAGRPAPGPWESLLQAHGLSEARRALPSRGRPLPDWSGRAVAGGYPVAAHTRDPAQRRAWFDGYVRTYVERDINDVTSVADLPDFRRLMRLASLRVGQVLNQSSLARDAGLTQPTAHRYLNLLETCYQIVRVAPYAVSRTTRVVKSPKLYWSDPGLAAFLAGFESAEDVANGPLAGAFFESLLLLHVLAWRDASQQRSEILYWRTHAGAEVDFILERGRRLLPIELNAGRRPRMGDAVSLAAFIKEHERLAPFGLLIHSGEAVEPLSDRILAVPMSVALGLG